MINKKLIPIFLLLFILPFYSSAQIEMKSSYDAGETLIAKVSGNFVQPVSEQNILFYRRHMPTSMESSLIKIDNDYYIYAQIPLEKIPDNYSIVLQGVKYFQGTQIKEENIVYNFSITNKTADFSVNPAVLMANSDFSISVQNMQDKEISLKVYFSNKTSSSGGLFSLFGGDGTKEFYSLLLDSGETKSIDFNLDNLTNGLNTIKIKSDNLEYLIPVHITKEKEKLKFSFERTELNVSTITNSSESREIVIYNSGEETIKDISLSLSSSIKPYVNLSIDSIKEIKAKSISEKVIITFFSKENIRVEGFVKAEQGDNVSVLSVYFNSFKESPSLQNNNSSSTSKTCSESNGTICGDGLTCNGTMVDASDDICCVGVCGDQDSSSSKKIIGWFLLIASILLIAWLLATKYLGAKNKVNFSSIIRNR